MSEKTTVPEICNMARKHPLVQAFTAFFVGPDGHFQHPGNVGGGRTVASVCRTIFQRPEPLLFDTLTSWDEKGTLTTQNGQTVNVLAVANVLRSLGQWEGAWAVAQLHYDQLLKQEAKQGVRLHKGHPACGLAILAHDLGTPRLSRHFALRSSAGDICWEHRDPELKSGGLGPTLLEQHESSEQHRVWRERVRKAVKAFPKSEPLYLEAFVTAGWFESHAKHIIKLAKVKGRQGKPFAEVLLDSVERSRNTNSTETGTQFEAASGLLLASTPGFEVDSARRTADEQIDLVIHYSPDKLCDLGLEPGFGLVECKSSQNTVGVSELRDFGSKCLFHRVRFGILVARAGVTKGLAKFAEPRNSELVRRRFQVDGLTLLVLDISHLRNKSFDLRGLQDDLKADYRRLVFGEVP